MLASLSQDLIREYRFTRKLYTDNAAQIVITKEGETLIMDYDYLRASRAERDVQIAVGNLRLRIKIQSANTEVWYSIEHSSKGSATRSVNLNARLIFTNWLLTLLSHISSLSQNLALSILRLPQSGN